MESCLTYLEGSRTHARYDADSLQTLDPIDGAPLLARYDLTRAARTLTPRSLAERPGPGMWRWYELLPVRDRRFITHLGEGSTPLLPAPRLGAALGNDRLLVKAEGLNPTGSFKARGMAAAVSRARELGARSLIAPSAGNAGGALAAYGAAAGMPVTVVVPVDTPTVNVVEAQMMGAAVILVEGFISDCGVISKAIAARTGAFDVSTLKEPYRVEGKKTMGLELVEQLSWGVPDVIVYPTGGGTGLVGMWKAFAELEALGLLTSTRPRMVAVQAEGCAPIVRAFRAGAETAEPWADPATRASGLRVPSAVGDRLILTALRESEGTAVAVPEDEIDAVQRLAGRRGVGYVSPESAAAFAAVGALTDEGWLAANDRVVVFDCGIGQKYPPPSLPQPPVVQPRIAGDEEALTGLLADLRGGGSGGGEPARRRSTSGTAAPTAAPMRSGDAAPMRSGDAPDSPLAALLARRRAERDPSTTAMPADADVAVVTDDMEDPQPTQTPPSLTPSNERSEAPPPVAAARAQTPTRRRSAVLRAPGRPRVPGEALGVGAAPSRVAPRIPGQAGSAVEPAPADPAAEVPSDATSPIDPLPVPPRRAIVVPPLPDPPRAAP